MFLLYSCCPVHVEVSEAERSNLGVNCTRCLGQSSLGKEVTIEANIQSHSRGKVSFESLVGCGGGGGGWWRRNTKISPLLLLFFSDSLSTVKVDSHAVPGLTTFLGTLSSVDNFKS